MKIDQRIRCIEPISPVITKWLNEIKPVIFCKRIFYECWFWQMADCMLFVQQKYGVKSLLYTVFSPNLYRSFTVFLFWEHYIDFFLKKSPCFAFNYSSSTHITKAEKQTDKGAWSLPVRETEYKYASINYINRQIWLCHFEEKNDGRSCKKFDILLAPSTCYRQNRYRLSPQGEPNLLSQLQW